MNFSFENVDYKKVLGNIFGKALLPNFILFSILIFIQWLAVGVWFMFSEHQHSDSITAIITFVSAIIPILALGVWAIRRFVIKSFSVLHEMIVKKLVEEFARKEAKYIVGYIDSKLKDSKWNVILKLKDWIEDKIKKSPSIIQKLIRFALSKIGYSEELERKINLITSNDEEEYFNLMNIFLNDLIQDAYEKSIPFWIGYLVLIINYGFLIALWFI